MLAAIVLLALSRSVVDATTTCSDAGNGPCINNACLGTGETCTTFSGTSVCCPASKLITSTTTRRASTCVDKVNPSTGVSDCPRRSYLCNDSTYYALMSEQCPKTCGRCSSSTNSTSSTCMDKLNPSTGTSDCPQLSAYCTNSHYKALMKQQCAKTCGYC